MLRTILTLVRDFTVAGSGHHCRACRATIHAGDGYGLSEGVCRWCRKVEAQIELNSA
jgi:hypothetical protein